MNEYMILFIELLGFVMFAYAESEIEGKFGGGGNNAKFFKLGPFRVRRYHFFVQFLAIPVFLSLPIIAAGFSWKLFGVLAGGAFIGGVLQDIFWFVFNPHYGLEKFSKENAYWLKWIRIWKLELPYFYFTHPILAVLIWFVFVL